MIRNASVFIISLTYLVILISGCAFLAEPKYERYEVTSDVEQFTDGSMYTSAKTQIPAYVKGRGIEDSRFTEAVVKLKSPREVRKVTVRRRTEDTVPVDINVLAKVGEEWKMLKQIRGEVKSDISIQFSPVVTKEIKIEAQRATRTADGKSAISVGPGRGAGRRGATGGGEVERLLREPVKIAEIEVYGLAKTETKTEKEK